MCAKMRVQKTTSPRPIGRRQTPHGPRVRHPLDPEADLPGTQRQIPLDLKVDPPRLEADTLLNPKADTPNTEADPLGPRGRSPWT